MALPPPHKSTRVVFVVAAVALGFIVIAEVEVEVVVVFAVVVVFVVVVVVVVVVVGVNMMDSLFLGFASLSGGMSYCGGVMFSR